MRRPQCIYEEFGNVVFTLDATYFFRSEYEGALILALIPVSALFCG